METTSTAFGFRNKGKASKFKGEKLPAETLTAAEVNSLTAACGTDCSTGLRNRALIVLLWRAGLRVSEALALLPRDIDHEACTINVLHGKGDKQRIVGVDPQALAVVQRWLDRRQQLGIDGRVTLLCTLDGGSLATAYVRNLLKRLAKEAGILKRCNPHSLRHTMASELRSEGTDIGVISKQLGHSNIATTARYLDHINPAAVVSTMQARSW